MYETLKKGGLVAEIVTKYHHQSAEELASVLTEEELASVLTEGLMMSHVGGIIKTLDKKTAGYGAICKAAFKAAVLRLIKEANDRRSRYGKK